MAPFPDLASVEIEHDSPLPLYSQLREGLLVLLKEGKFQEGDPFPTERELGQRFKVSRITVRRAIDELVDDAQYVLARVLMDRLHHSLEQVGAHGSDEASYYLEAQCCSAAGNRLVHDAERVAHGPVSGFRKRRNRVVVDGDAFFLGDGL